MISTLVLASSLWFAAGETGPAETLDRAHQAFLAKDYLAMTGALRDLLADQDADQTMRDNALSLLAEAYAETGGGLPADWQAPKGLTKLRVHQTRRQEPERVFYKVRLRADIPEKDTVIEAQLVRYPNEVILDKQAGQGEWEVEQDEGMTWWYFGFEASMPAPLPEGLYLLRFETKGQGGQGRSEGWFILSDLAASESPVIDRPEADSTVPDGSPEIVWRDFRSPEHKPYESRGMAVSLVKIGVDPNVWDLRWALYTDPRPVTRAIVGKEPDQEGHGPWPLEPGRYWLSVEYSESKRFGPMTLRRISRTGRSFSVSGAPVLTK